jgi:hypothetical protein
MDTRPNHFHRWRSGSFPSISSLQPCARISRWLGRCYSQLLRSWCRPLRALAVFPCREVPLPEITTPLGGCSTETIEDKALRQTQTEARIMSRDSRFTTCPPKRRGACKTFAGPFLNCPTSSLTTRQSMTACLPLSEQGQRTSARPQESSCVECSCWWAGLM